MLYRIEGPECNFVIYKRTVLHPNSSNDTCKNNRFILGSTNDVFSTEYVM